MVPLPEAPRELRRIHLPRTPANSPARDLQVLPRRPSQAGLTGARALPITRSAAGAKSSRVAGSDALIVMAKRCVFPPYLTSERYSRITSEPAIPDVFSPAFGQVSKV